MNVKPRHYLTAAGCLLGAVCAFAGPGGSVLLTLLKPFALLGSWLRNLSLSGSAGNAGAWAVVTALSLLPVAFILIARRKWKQKDDFLWLIAGAGVFGCLFLLVNPTLTVNPALLTAGDLLKDELLAMAPAMTMLSLLLAAVLSRWSGGLKDRRLSRWLGALLAVMMALIALNLTKTAVAVFRAPAMSDTDRLPSSLYALPSQQADGSRAAQIALTLVPLIPDLFFLWTLDGASKLAHEAGLSLLSDRTEDCAAALALRARVWLIVSACCIAVENALTMLMSGALTSTDVALTLPLTDMALSCGAMLLARLIESACRVKRENDLMI